MIAFVEGRLETIETDSAIVNVGGVGYRVFTPLTQNLLQTDVGSQIRFYTYLCVREDAMLLYGFLDHASLDIFKQLINVSGVGPKYALSILSSLNLGQIISAVINEDAKTLSTVPGIGAKTAARIIVDLKDKLKDHLNEMDEAILKENAAGIGSFPMSSFNEAASETVKALESLGYSAKEAQQAVKQALSELDDEKKNDSSLVLSASLKYLM